MSLDAKKEELYKLMADPEIYQQSGKVAGLKAEVEETEETLARAYKRWEGLEAIKEASEN
ncbi:MAG: hypothetical protein IMF07_04645 [Proteobacteria bacterium]|nr:hypothetical protein [Pseudomonadota bacterium]